MPMKLRVPFGLKDDRLWEPGQVPNGKACSCVCPVCQRPLIARQNHTTPHFAHSPGEDCAKALETAVHLAAKQLIADQQELRLPALRYLNLRARGLPVQEIDIERVIPVETVAQELWMGEMRPDIVVTHENETYLVEIAVTHFVDDIKMGKIRARHLPALEIDVSALKGHFTFAALTELLYSTKPYPATWLYHPRQEKLALEAHQKYLAELAEREEAAKIETEARHQQETNDAAEIAKIRKYRDMPASKKLALNLRKLGLIRAQFAKFSTFVPFEKTFYCPREVWQSAVLAYLAHQQREQDELLGKRYPALIAPKNCLLWLEIRFPVDPANDNNKHTVAFWKYIHFLRGLRVLKKLENGDYYLELPPEMWGQMKAPPKQGTQ